MSALDNFILNDYSYENFKNFIIQSFGEDIGIKTEDSYPYDKSKDNIIKSYTQVCNNISLDSKELAIYAFETKSIHAKITLHKELAKIMSHNTTDAILAVFYDDENTDFRLSLVTKGFDFTQNKLNFSNFYRASFTLGKNAKTKTAKSQLESFINTQTKSFQSLQEAFSVEPVTKAFYEHYKSLYENLSHKLCANMGVFNILQGYEGLSGEKAINAFVKKLLGRIVFLYFLQKKGWLGVKKEDVYGKGDKNFLFSLFNKAKQRGENFYETYLCPLFFESLNSQRKDEYSPLFEGKIPFLNGGLFEESKDSRGKGIETDFIICKILENADFESIFDVFESYNFTIEESTPENEEIGIDPEMLGKIFENLIEYNKENGAFYTPRKIVHFMCKNILTRTLQERIAQISNDQRDSIYNLIFYAQVDDFIQSKAKQLTNIITSLKILDPALGSGAFPMGLLNEILNVLHTLNPTLQKAEIANLKREIIAKQIYGIDIDADAIEVAKLRFWLSIAVDEDTPKPLPNLDFKFMQGNSLIETINGIDVMPNDKTLTRDRQLHDIDINSSIFNKEQVRQLEALFKKYYEPNAPKDSIKKEILKIMKEAFSARIECIDKIIKSEQNNPKVKPKDIAKQQKQILEYEDFKNKLNTLYDDYEKYNFHSDKLFLYNFFFADAFAQGGFDIVIGNPPYIRQEAIPNKNIILNAFKELTYPKILPKDTFAFANSSADIYTYFYAKGLSLLCKGGFLSFITSNKWCRGGYGKNLRELLLNIRVDSHYDFNGVKIFENATVDTAITTLYALPSTESSAIAYALAYKKDAPQAKEHFYSYINHITKQMPQNALSKETFIFSDLSTQNLKNKIETLGTPLKSWDISIYRGILTGYNEAFIIDTNKRNEILSKCDDSEDSLKAYPLSEYRNKLHEVPTSQSVVGVEGEFEREEGATSQFKPLRPLIEKRIDTKNNTILLTERERTAQLIKPILRGRDIKRYSYEWAGLWLIFISWHFPNTYQPKTMQENEQDLKNQYPSLYKHLLSHKEKLSQRNKDETGIRYEWYCLQRYGANYYNEFAKPKIVWNPVSGEYFFTYIRELMYFNNSLFMMTLKEYTKQDNLLLYILGLMNSTLYKWLITQMTNLVEEGKYAYGAKDKIEKLPIPKLSKSQESEFVAIVQKIIDMHKHLKVAQNAQDSHMNLTALNEKLNTLQSQLDSMVYKLYGLDDTEIELIRGG